MSGHVEALARDILAQASGGVRYVFAIAGAPGSGKSTLAQSLLAALERRAPPPSRRWTASTSTTPCSTRGLRSRKGAPETFDAEGLAVALGRIGAARAPVALPVFDCDLDLARAGARIVGPGQPVILVEGNYLLLRDAPWSGLAPQFDRTLFLSVPEDELARRLTARWLRHGLDPDAARAPALGNDIPNARLVAARSRPADVTWTD